MTDFILTAMHLFNTNELFWIFFKGIMIKSLSDLVKNILFFGAGAALIYWLSDKIGIVAKILFAIFALIAIFEGVRMLFVVITDLITVPVMIFINDNGDTEIYEDIKEIRHKVFLDNN